MSRRTEKVASVIRQEVATAILRDLDDPRLGGLLPSVTRVKVAEDLSTADVYVAMMGTPGKQSAGLAALKHAAGLMRSKVGEALATRTVPYLRFQLDEAYRKEIEVLELIRKAEQELAADAGPAGAGGGSGDPDGRGDVDPGDNE